MRYKPSLNCLVLSSAFIFLCLAIHGCSSDKKQAKPNNGTGVSADTIHVGTLSVHAENQDLTRPFGIISVPNVDDDNLNGITDWQDGSISSDNDKAHFSISTEKASEVSLTLTSPADSVRIWHNDAILVSSSNNHITLTADMATTWQLTLEFSGFLTQAELHYSDGVNEILVPLTSAPLILNNHLQPVEHVWAVKVDRPGNENNSAFIQLYQDHLGDKFTAVDNTLYNDVWIQDEFEFTNLTAPSQRMPFVMDSIRNRGLKDYAKENIAGQDYGIGTWGAEQRRASTYESFGNLEASPPITVNGIHYPFGRIYYGYTEGAGPVIDLRDFLDSQTVQKPFFVDTSWLLVGHVDEISSSVPDISSDKGYKFLFADTVSAYEILDDMNPEITLPRFASSYGINTVADMQQDEAIRNLNTDIQLNHLNPILAKFKQELGLSDEDIILVPMIFEEQDPVRLPGKVVALIPGMINLVVANIEGHTPKLFIADPFMRSDESNQNTDPFIQAMLQKLPDELELLFTDAWYVYHVMQGEVHCGTNTQRRPIANWWENTRHLIKPEML